MNIKKKINQTIISIAKRNNDKNKERHDEAFEINTNEPGCSNDEKKAINQ